VRRTTRAAAALGGALAVMLAVSGAAIPNHRTGHRLAEPARVVEGHTTVGPLSEPGDGKDQDDLTWQI
jgi:hypothetical protein